MTAGVDTSTTTGWVYEVAYNMHSPSPKRICAGGADVFNIGDEGRVGVGRLGRLGTIRLAF